MKRIALLLVLLMTIILCAACTPKLEGVEAGLNGVTSIAVGESTKVYYNLNPSDAKAEEIKFSSSDTSIATVNSKGKIKAKAPGTCTITVKADGFSDSVDITITPIDFSKLWSMECKSLLEPVMLAALPEGYSLGTVGYPEKTFDIGEENFDSNCIYSCKGQFSYYDNYNSGHLYRKFEVYFYNDHATVVIYNAGNVITREVSPASIRL